MIAEKAVMGRPQYFLIALPESKHFILNGLALLQNPYEQERAYRNPLPCGKTFSGTEDETFWNRTCMVETKCL